MQHPTPVTLYIVVADDDPDDHQLIKDAFQECDKNHIVTSVYNGEQLLDLLNERGFYKRDYHRLPDLIILDLKMPLMDGMEVLEKIKANEDLKKIPVYILTETNMKAIARKATELGAEDFFTKPLIYDELRDLMIEVCKKVSSSSGRA